MKTYFIVLFTLGASLSVKAQSYFTAVPFITANQSVQSVSLGNSNVAGKGDTWAYHLNPAGIFYGDSAARLSFHTFTPYDDFNDQRINSIIGGHQFNQLAISYSLVDYDLGIHYITEQTSPEIIDKYRPYEIAINFSAAYHFDNGFTVGGGINYIHSDLGGDQKINGREIYPGKALSLDIGTRYENAVYTSDYFSILTGLGFSLTDFGNKVKYTDNSPGDPLPMILRGGLEVSLKSENQYKGLDLFEVSYSSALSKYMAGVEIKPDSSVEAYGPVKSLFKTWNSFEWFNGREYLNVSLLDQIWKHHGIEFSLLETFFLRFGYEIPEKPRVDDYKSIGFGIDLYYLRFDYAKKNYESRGYTFIKEQYFWQLSARIPLHGKRPDTILHHLFK